MKHIISIDCDMNRFHAWSNKTGKVCYNETDIHNFVFPRADKYLFECASPVMHGDKAADYNKKRWALCNMFFLGIMATKLQNLFVAPSSIWTNGMSEDIRAVTAGVKWIKRDKKGKAIHKTVTKKEKETGRIKTSSVVSLGAKDNHDLRECQCMLYFHNLEPHKWIEVNEYMKRAWRKKK